jgi:hypothetical protein
VSVSHSEFHAFVKKGKIADLTLGKETITGMLSTDGLGDLTAQSLTLTMEA